MSINKQIKQWLKRNKKIARNYNDILFCEAVAAFMIENKTTSFSEEEAMEAVNKYVHKICLSLTQKLLNVFDDRKKPIELEEYVLSQLITFWDVAYKPDQLIAKLKSEIKSLKKIPKEDLKRIQEVLGINFN